MALKIDYKDDILVSEARKFNLIQNTDGTVSLEDVSEYQQVGDTFGAKDVNETNTAVNQINEKLESFEQTKYDIVGSGLGTALGMSTSIKWTDLVTKIKSVTNQGAKTSSLNCGGSYTIPAGYHNGSGKVTVTSLASNIGTSVTLDNNARLLSGYTAYGKNGTKYTGSIANKGTLNWSGSNTTYSVPAGYYSGGTLDSRPSYNAGVVAADSRANPNSINYQTGYNSGVTDADNRANANSFNYQTGYGAGRNSMVMDSYVVASTATPVYGEITWTVDTAGWYTFIYGGSIAFTGTSKETSVIFMVDGTVITTKAQSMKTAYDIGGGGFAFSEQVYCAVGQTITAKLSGDNVNNNSRYFGAYLSFVRMR